MGNWVIWFEDRLAFEQLGRRLGLTPAVAADLAAQMPAHFIAFGLLQQHGLPSSPLSTPP